MFWFMVMKIACLGIQITCEHCMMENVIRQAFKKEPLFQNKMPPLHNSVLRATAFPDTTLYGLVLGYPSQKTASRHSLSCVVVSKWCPQAMTPATGGRQKGSIGPSPLGTPTGIPGWAREEPCSCTSLGMSVHRVTTVALGPRGAPAASASSFSPSLARCTCTSLKKSSIFLCLSLPAQKTEVYSWIQWVSLSLPSSLCSFPEWFISYSIFLK